MPVDAVATAKDMKLTVITIINDHIFKVNESAINLRDSVQLLEDSVASLVINYYVLGINYTEPLKYIFFLFFLNFNSFALSTKMYQ